MSFFSVCSPGDLPTTRPSCWSEGSAHGGRDGTREVVVCRTTYTELVCECTRRHRRAGSDGFFVVFSFERKQKKQVHCGRRDRGSFKVLRRPSGVKQTPRTTCPRGACSPRRRRMIKCLFNNIKTYSKRKKKKTVYDLVLYRLVSRLRRANTTGRVDKLWNGRVTRRLRIEMHAHTRVAYWAAA